MSIQDIRRANLRLMVRKTGSQTELAKLVGTNRLYLSQILSATTARNLGDKLARKIEKSMTLSEGWMDRDNTAGPIAHESNRLLPELTEKQVLKWDESMPMERGGIVVARSKVGDHAFAYRVGKQEVGQVPAGSVVVVDPDERPQSDDVVLVSSELANRVFVRRLDIGLVGKPRLVADMTGESVEMPDGARVVGVVREVSLHLR
jgi:transcriptional regulator with XRE-family HTH domain